MPFIDLKRQYQLHKEAFDNAIHAVLNHGQYIHGPEVTEFEHRLQRFANVKHAITCGNGTDALVLALQAMHLQKGDVVFVPSLTFAATAEAVALSGGIPFFVDIDEKTFNLSVKSLKEAVSELKRQSLKAVGIIAVDLFGLAADYTAINDIAKENNLWVMSDCAQGFGCTHNGHMVCSCRDRTIATTSFSRRSRLVATVTAEPFSPTMTERLRLFGVCVNTVKDPRNTTMSASDKTVAWIRFKPPF